MCPFQASTRLYISDDYREATAPFITALIAHPWRSRARTHYSLVPKITIIGLRGVYSRYILHLRSDEPYYRWVGEIVMNITAGEIPTSVVGLGGEKPASRSGRSLHVVAMVEEASAVSGTGKPVLEFARQAASQELGSPRVDVTILTFIRTRENEFIAAARAEGFRLEIIRENGRFDWAVIRQLQSAIHRCEPDVIWTNSVKSHFLVRLAGLNRKARWVAFHHGYTNTNWVDRIYSQFDRWSLHGAFRVITVCQAFANLIQRRNGVAFQRIRIQHVPVRPWPPVPMDEVAGLRHALGLEKEYVFLAVGRLSKEKGHADFIRGLAQLRRMEPGLSFRALIVGDGPERPDLERLCSTLNLTNVIQFLGYQKRIQPYYELADIFVLSSHSEGTPNVLLEAMASGTPIVCTAVGGIPELARNCIEVLMVPPKNPELLARAILDVIQDPTLSAQLIRAAHRIVANHSPEQFFRSICSVFQEN